MFYIIGGHPETPRITFFVTKQKDRELCEEIERVKK